tara:strand:- start:222 stop:623 length:402 start_codon:yes stop_codon:yes gene_type:complete
MINLLLYLAFFCGASSDLTVNISGIESIKGSVYIAVFTDRDSFPVFGKQWRGESISVTEKSMSYTFKNILHGTYAIAVFHDENDNGVMDKNALGIPLEPYGFSQNARARFSAPPFKDAQFELKGKKSIHISIH